MSTLSEKELSFRFVTDEIVREDMPHSNSGRWLTNQAREDRCTCKLSAE
jgi:hypothetical protein